MQRTRRCDTLYVLSSLIGVGKAQTVANILLARDPILLAVITSNSPNDASSTTTTPITSTLGSLATNSSSSSLDPTAPVQSTDPGISSPPTSVPVIAGSLAGFMVILAAVLVCLVVQRNKRRRRKNKAIHHPISGARIVIPSNANSLPLYSRKTGSRRSFVEPSSPDSDASPLPETQSNKRSRVPREREPSNTRYSSQRGVATGGQSCTNPDRPRHLPTTSTSTTTSSVTLNTDRSSDIKATIAPTEASSESYSYSIFPTTTASSNLSSQCMPSIPIASPSPLVQTHPHPNIHSHTSPLSPSPLTHPQHNSPIRQSSSPVPPEVQRQNLITLLEQQRDALQSQANNADEDTLSAVEHLSEQIQSLLRQRDRSSPGVDAPPAYAQ